MSEEKWTVQLKIQAVGVLKRLSQLAEVMENARSSYGQAKGTLEKAKDEHSLVVRKRLVAISTMEQHQNLIDPRTGKSNTDWTKLIIDNAMDTDEETLASYYALTTARDRVASEENNVLSLSDEIGVLKAQARLLAAIFDWSEA